MLGMLRGQAGLDFSFWGRQKFNESIYNLKYEMK